MVVLVVCRRRVRSSHAQQPLQVPICIPALYSTCNQTTPLVFGNISADAKPLCMVRISQRFMRAVPIRVPVSLQFRVFGQEGPTGDEAASSHPSTGNSPSPWSASRPNCPAELLPAYAWCRSCGTHAKPEPTPSENVRCIVLC
jgi:hypothetical protein